MTDVAVMKKRRTSWTREEDMALYAWSPGQGSFIDLMTRIGRTVYAGHNRLEKLRRDGLRPQAVVRSKGVLRPCLSCHEEFLSSWKGNRLCASCKARGYSPGL